MAIEIEEINIHSWEDWCKHMNVIPKDQYEARLKADMVAMLTEIQLEIEDTGAYEQEVNGKTEYLNGINYAYSVIHQKINVLKGESQCFF